MHGPFPPAVSRSDIYISGDVTIEERVTIGPGVVLQATPGSRLIIRMGACLGAGAVLHAHQGLLEIQTDVIVGARALIIGTGTVGTAACLGAESTVITPDIAPQQSVANGALVGAPVDSGATKTASRTRPNRGGHDRGNGSQPKSELEDLWGEPDVATETLPRSLDPIGLQQESAPATPAGDRNGRPRGGANATTARSNRTANNPAREERSEKSVDKDKELSPPDRSEETIIGRAYVNQLMVTLFPHKNKKL